MRTFFLKAQTRTPCSTGAATMTHTFLEQSSKLNFCSSEESAPGKVIEWIGHFVAVKALFWGPTEEVGIPGSFLGQ